MSFDCPKYEADSSGRRCKHFQNGGTCLLPDEMMCVVWLAKQRAKLEKVAEPAAPPPGGYPTAEFSLAVQVPEEYVQKQKATSPRPEGEGESSQSVKQRERAKAFSLAPSAKPDCGCADFPVGFRLGDIAEMKARGVEIELETENQGTIFIVPNYNPSSGRRELSYESLATLVGALLVFPGSRITELKFPSETK